MHSNHIQSIIANSSTSLSEENIERGKWLGSGTFGVVQQIVSKETFAFKQIDLKKLVNDPADEKELYNELISAFSEFQIMKKNHQNVVRSYQYHFDKDDKIFSFTMDLMKGKDLGTLIQMKSIPFEDFYKLFQDIVTGKRACLSFANKEKNLN
jgi:serine/threonine protein kinase